MCVCVCVSRSETVCVGGGFGFEHVDTYKGRQDDSWWSLCENALPQLSQAFA